MRDSRDGCHRCWQTRNKMILIVVLSCTQAFSPCLELLVNICFELLERYNSHAAGRAQYSSMMFFTVIEIAGIALLNANNLSLRQRILFTAEIAINIASCSGCKRGYCHTATPVDAKTG